MQDSREKVVDLIFKAVDFDKGRGCTVESVLQQLRALGIIKSLAYVRAGGITLQWSWTEHNVRVLIAELIKEERLDMDSTGRLSILEAEDPETERFNGSWYSTKNGRIRGPFKTKGEAVRA
jgi:hypothetical protein